MTEKQYSLVYYPDKGGAFIKNNETGNEWYHDSRASLLDVVSELNGLIEKNKVLYKEIERLKRQNEDILYNNAKNMESLEKENKELKDKNSQLQETLAFRSNQLTLMERLVDDLGSEEMARQMEEILND